MHRSFSLLLVFIIVLLSGCSTSVETPIPSSSPTFSPPVDPAVMDEVCRNCLAEYREDPPEPFTCEMVDYIAMCAREKAKTITDDLTHAALTYISANILDPDLYEKQYTMESMMYFGNLLDYAYKREPDKKLYAEVGWDTVRAIKDVYRDWEPPEDSLSPREQAVKGLIELGYLKPSVLDYTDTLDPIFNP